MPESPFKTCTNCFRQWNTIDEFLADHAIELIGYQPNFKELEAGALLFNHKPCLSTFALDVRAFRHLHQGPVFSENKAGKEGCPAYCLFQLELGPCQNDCECRWVRDVIQVIKDYQKAC